MAGVSLIVLLFTLVASAGFCLLFVLVVLGIVRGTKGQRLSRQVLELTVEATVVTKRTEVARRQNDSTVSHAATRCYATFSVQSGDRMELLVPGSEYGLLTEGDVGRLTFRGAEFLRFDRQ